MSALLLVEDAEFCDVVVFIFGTFLHDNAPGESVGNTFFLRLCIQLLTLKCEKAKPTVLF